MFRPYLFIFYTLHIRGIWVHINMYHWLYIKLTNLVTQFLPQKKKKKKKKNCKQEVIAMSWLANL